MIHTEQITRQKGFQGLARKRLRAEIEESARKGRELVVHVRSGQPEELTAPDGFVSPRGLNGLHEGIKVLQNTSITIESANHSYRCVHGNNLLDTNPIYVGCHRAGLQDMYGV